MLWLIMFQDNDSQLVVNLDYQLVEKELTFMIIKTFFIRHYSIKCDQSLDSLEHHIMHHIISLINNSFLQSNFKLRKYHHIAFLI